MSTINTKDEDDKKNVDEGLIRILLIVAAVIISPLTALSSGLVYYLFSYVKIRRSVIALFSAPIFLITLIFIIPLSQSFVASWSQTFPTILNGTTPIFSGILTMLGQQFFLSTTVGILIGLGLATWRWFTRARWKNIEFKKTPWEVLRRKKTIKKIQDDEDTPFDGMTLGINDEGRREVQTTADASGHTLIIGGTGAGKSQTAKMRIRDQIKRGEGVCVVDLKADPELVEAIAIYAKRYGRKFKHFTIQDITKPYDGPADLGNSHYDPLAQGDHTRRADMVLDLREWDASSDYFKKMTQSYLQLLFAVLIANPKPGISTLEDAIDLMSPQKLQERARPLASDPHFANYVRSIDALNDEKLSGNVKENLQTNRSQLEIFLQSVAGPWLTLDKSKNNNNISLEETAYNGDVVVFSLDSLAYPSLASHLANLIIQDLKTVSSTLLKKKPEKTFNVFIDEFSAIGSDNIIGLINKARASNMSVTIATQTLSDLEVKTKNLGAQIIGILGSFIIHRANTEADATIYAGLTGMEMRMRARQSVNQTQNLWGGIGSGIGTGVGSVEEVEEREVKPAEIQALKVGEFYYISAQSHIYKKVTCIIDDLSHEKMELEQEIHQRINSPILETVNQQFTLTPSEPLIDLDKGTVMPKETTPPTDHNIENDFEEAKELKKVPLNYNLLRSFFNAKDDVDLQEAEDRADGVIPELVATPVSNQSQPEPANGTSVTSTKPQRPAFPKRPVKPQIPSTPSKGEFDF